MKMQQGSLAIGAVAVAAILIGVGLYFYAQTQTPGGLSYVPPSATSTLPAQPETVSFRVLDEGANAANVSVRKNYAAYSEESFQKIWNMANGFDGKTPPNVDFSKEYVIGVFAGQKPTGGYSIVVTSVTDTGDTRTVAITLTAPGENCMVTEALTSPYQILAVPRSSALLAHADTGISTPCN